MPAARPLLVALALVATALAGCLAPQEVQTAAVEAPPIRLVDVPDGAEVVPFAEGLRLVWKDVPLPFDEDLTIPEGVTLVRARLTLPDERFGLVVLEDPASGALRCWPTFVRSWSEDVLGGNVCAGLTAIDPLPAKWTIFARAATTGMLPVMRTPAVAELLEVDLVSLPLDGPVASLDLSQLSMPTMAETDTEAFTAPGHDGTPLHVEVTLPDGDGPFPAILHSSPYNDGTRRFGGRPQDDLVKDLVPRGYAVVVADVRGYGDSGGCVEVWGPNEQKDQAALVQWIAEQEWSDGNVGFYGVSYDGTTAVEAAVEAPEALKAVVSVAPVINAYDDWHFGGVPNGEDLGSPAGYQSIGLLASVRPQDPRSTVLNHANGLCEPALVAQANDPRALYDAFYEARNFSARAASVKAPFLYMQGFEDSNVKGAMANWWFNALEGPKLGLFGHWIHQHPPRPDQGVLMLAWFDEHLKGRPVGLSTLPAASVVTDARTHRALDAWPPAATGTATLWPDLAAGALGAEPADGEAALLVAPAWTPGSGGIELAGTVAERTELAGVAELRLAASLAAGGNAHVAAFLYDGDSLVTWGMFNLAHRNGHDSYAPLAPGEVAHVSLPFLPTDHVFEAGDDVRLVVRGAYVDDWFLVKPTAPGRLTVHGGADGTSLVLPTLDAATAEPAPRTVDWEAGSS